eukprot:6169330-Prymnesium_polylepis.1
MGRAPERLPQLVALAKRRLADALLAGAVVQALPPASLPPASLPPPAAHAPARAGAGRRPRRWREEPRQVCERRVAKGELGARQEVRERELRRGADAHEAARAPKGERAAIEQPQRGPAKGGDQAEGARCNQQRRRRRQRRQSRR